MKEKIFANSLPVWAKGLENTVNVTCGIYATVDTVSGRKYKICVTASSFYRLFINGEFVNHGPARCGHGYYRVDELDLTDRLCLGRNSIAIEAVGYNVNSFYSLDQPSFVQAEVFENGRTVAATGGLDFTGLIITERRRRMQRYSFQRTIVESYILKPGYDAWRTEGIPQDRAVPLVRTEEKSTVHRGIPLCHFNTVSPTTIVSRGNVCSGVKPSQYFNDRSLVSISKKLKGYREDELELHLSDELSEMRYSDFTDIGRKYGDCTDIPAGSFAIFALESEKTGFIKLRITCKIDSVLYIMNDERLTNGDVDPLLNSCVNAVRLDLAAGDYSFMTMEPYGFKYLKLVCTEGKVNINEISLVEYACSERIINRYHGNDATLDKIYTAAVETFRQNSADLFSDCPTRERAGWLCDSFFTARVEKCLTGGNRTEKIFLENFLCTDEYKCIPRGMLPMCYPADHYDGVFIPNWAMWFVIELGDYFDRTGDMDFVRRFCGKVYDLIEYFRSFENELGLLEKLESWVFVEWSKANDLVQDVNYPSNMLYSMMLRYAGRLFDDDALTEKAKKIAETVRRRSFDGSFFVDNEIRRDGILTSTGERTEVCQYYAFFCGIATPESHPELWRKLTEEFGPERAQKGLYPEIYPANAFIGNYLRLDILTENGRGKQCLDEMSGYFLYMAEKTGTLWENTTDFASCNHGFASYAAYLIDRNDR